MEVGTPECFRRGTRSPQGHSNVNGFDRLNFYDVKTKESLDFVLFVDFLVKGIQLVDVLDLNLVQLRFQ